MNKNLLKIMGVVGTVAMLGAIFMTTSPVAAADQTWSKVALPSATGYVMPNNIIASGPVAQAFDGSAIFVAVTQVGPTYNILKSTDGGKTWAISGTSSTAMQPTQPVTALAVSPTNASVVYYAETLSGVSTLFKSTDGGADFLAEANIPTGGGAIDSLAVGVINGNNMVIAGTQGAGYSGNVYYCDESQTFLSFQLLGTNNFATSLSTAVNVTGVAVSPNFATDRAVWAVGTNATNTFISVNEFGGAWGANVKSPTVTSPINASSSVASFAFPSDFSMTTSPNFFIAIDGAKGDVYRIQGNNVASTDVALSYSSSSTIYVPTFSLAISGPFASASLFAGCVNTTVGTTAYGGVVESSTNGGVTWSASSTAINTTSTKKGPSGTGSVIVWLSPAYATNSTVFALTTPTAGVGDQSGLSVSVDKGTSYNQYSLLNNAITSINSMANSGSTLFVATTQAGSVTNAVTAGSLTITAGTEYKLQTPAVLASTATFNVAAATPDITTFTVIGSTQANAITLTGATAGTTVTQIGSNSWQWNTNDIAGASSVTLTTLYMGTVVKVSQSQAGTFSSVSTSNGAVWTADGTDNGGVLALPNQAAAEIDTAFTNTVITGLPVTGISVVFSNPSDNYNASTGTIAFFAPGDTALVTNTGTAISTNLVATYSVGSGINTPIKPLFTAGTNATIAATSPNSGVNDAFTAMAGVAYSNTTRDSVFRSTDMGVTWQRVYNMTENANGAAANFVTLSPNFATDGTVLLAGMGTINAITYSSNNGQVWATQWNNVTGSLQALALIQNTTTGTLNLVAGTNSGAYVYKTTSINSILPWTAGVTPSTSATLTAGVTSLALSSNGSTLALGTANNQAALSSDFGTTWNVVGVGTTPTAIPGTVGNTSVAFAQGSTTSLFAVVTGQPDIFRYPSVSGSATWDMVDVNSGAANLDAPTGVNVSNAGMNITAGVAGGTGNVVVYTLDQGNQAVTNGSVASVTVTNSGQLYATGTYPIVFTGGGGTGAAGYAIVYNGNVTSVVMTSGGSGYTSAPTVSITQTPGFGFSGIANLGVSVVGGATQHVARIATQALANPAGANAASVFSGNTIGLPAGAVLANATLWGSFSSGSNALYVAATVSSSLGLWTYTDHMAVPVTGVTATATTPLNSNVSSAVVEWNSVPVGSFTGTVTYQVAITAASSAIVNPYIAASQITGTGSSVNSTTNSTYTFSNLTPNTQYSVSVWAASLGGLPTSFVGGYTFTTPLATPTSPISLAPPPAATNVPVSPTFQWAPVTGATSYTLELSTSPTFPTGSSTTVITGIATNAYVWAGAPLSSNTPYYWQVQAVTSSGTSAWVTSAFTTVPATTPPVTVTTSTSPNITLTQLPPASTSTPGYIWAIILVGAILTVAVIVLIVRTRRVV